MKDNSNPGYKKFKFPEIVNEFYATAMEKTSTSNKSANAQFLTQLLNHYAKEAVKSRMDVIRDKEGKNLVDSKDNKLTQLENFYKCVAALKLEYLLESGDETTVEKNIKNQTEYDNKLKEMTQQVKKDFKEDKAKTSYSDFPGMNKTDDKTDPIIKLVYDALKKEIKKTRVLGVGKSNSEKLKTILANTRRVFQKMLVPTAFYPMLKFAFGKKSTTEKLSQKITEVQNGYGAMNPAREFSSLGFINGAARDSMRKVLDKKENNKNFLKDFRFSSKVKEIKKHNAKKESEGRS